MFPENHPNNKGLQLLSEVQQFTDFEKLYLQVRKIEKRIYTDEEVKILPFASSANPYQKEWQVRAKTTQRFLKYLQKKGKEIHILDLACGNGWFSARIAEEKQCLVSAMDVNLSELEQAARLFIRPNLRFFYGNIFEAVFPEKTFDVISINAAMQYFVNLPDLIKRLFYFLKPEGEIHFLDSPFYEANVIDEAKERSRKYYQSLGYPEMSAYYFHHSWDELKSFRYKIFYQPANLKNKLLQKIGKLDSFFPWICISK